MKVVHTIDEVRAAVAAARTEGKKIGFVPTMGYLHRGHTSLVQESQKLTGYQVMSIFVNKIQFNDPRDFANYPKDLERDFDYAKSVGVDLVFVPADTEMYRSHLTYVDVDFLTTHLCGAHRPGHFRGVYTVVSKLFNIVQPDVAVFGQKDIQQAVTIEKMVLDLNFPVRIIIAPIIREDDGLAMSSRNKHLDATRRKNALAISLSLRKAEDMLTGGARDADMIASMMRKVLEEGKPDSIDYVSVVGYDTLQPVAKIEGRCVIAVAAFFGTTRLIDNMIVDVTGGVRCTW